MTQSQTVVEYPKDYSQKIATCCLNALLPTKEACIQYQQKCCNENRYPYILFGSEKPEVVVGRTYSLTAREIEVCEFLGPLRTKASRDAGLKNMLQVPPQKERFVEVNGIMGEFLYAKLFNFFPKEQFVIQPRKAKDDRGEFTHQGWQTDVKATEHHAGRLTLGHWKAATNIDLLCLFTNYGGRYDDVTCRYLWPEACVGQFKYRGFYPAKALAQPCNYGKMPLPNQYTVTQDKLLTLEAAILMMETQKFKLPED